MAGSLRCTLSIAAGHLSHKMLQELVRFRLQANSCHTDGFLQHYILKLVAKIVIKTEAKHRMY
jgi:hypothetical protein